MHAITRPVARLLRPVLDYALPPRCPGCGVIVEDDSRFCLSCWSSMEFLGEPCCERCGSSFPYDMGPAALCAPCMATPSNIDRTRAILAYGDLARSVALKLKYGRRIGLARLIAGQMVRHIPAEDRHRMLIVPVPLHRWRLWWRGFNQSALIADHLARSTGIAIDKEVLIRTKRTPPLRNLGPKARRRVVRDAFALASGAKPKLSNKIVVLIDDVHTSGATGEACAARLRKGGAEYIHLLCWARVLSDRVDD